MNTVITLSTLSFSDRYVMANSADPDQTAPRGSTLFVIPSALYAQLFLSKDLFV